MITGELDYRAIAEKIFLAGIEGVKPSVLIRKNLRVDRNGLILCNTLIPFHPGGRIFVAGAGKASGAMAEAAEEILGERIAGGHVIVKYGHECKLSRIRVTGAGHPIPDINGFNATRDIMRIASAAREDDILLCLISGGGSALMVDYPEGASMEDILKMNDLLVKCGASISEINTVRKHLSEIKGGKLSRLAWPATVVTLMISDVPGDDPSIIASGPTCPDDSGFDDAMKVIEKYGLVNSMPDSLLLYLKKGITGMIPENPRTGDQVFLRTFNFITGNNRMALEAAKIKAVEYGFDTVIQEECLTTNAATAAEYLTGKAISVLNQNPQRPVCLLFGGEVTLKVEGEGTGGRNQHLALLCAKALRRYPGITVLCGGTDGTDGPTSAAGAVVDSDTWTEAIMNRIDPQIYLDNFDSFNFFREAGGHIITGPTLTNVMDITVVLIRKNSYI